MLNIHVRDNLNALRAGEFSISGQATNRIPYASSATQLTTAATLEFTGTDLKVGGVSTGDIQIGGTDVMDARLEVYNESTSRPNIAAYSNVAMTVPVVRIFQDNAGASGNALTIQNDGTGMGIGFVNDGLINAASNLRLFTNGVEAVRVHTSRGVSIGDTTDPGAGNLRVLGTSALVGTVTHSGATTMTGAVTGAGTIKSSGQPGFLAYNSASDAGVASGTTIGFDTEVYDELGDFSGTVFSAPVAGRYLFTVGVATTVGSVASRGFELVTSNRSYLVTAGGVPSGTDLTQTFSVIADMDINDTARVNLASSTALTVTGGGTSTHFSGRLLV